METYLLAKDGCKIPYFFSGRRVTMGCKPYVLLVGMDMTERKQAEAALRQAHKLESLGIMAGGLAHDFNDRLVSILAQSSLALTRLPAGHPARAHVVSVVHAAEHAADLIQQLLTYSGGDQVKKPPIALNEIIRDNLAIFSLGVNKRIQLHAELGPDLPPVAADSSQMQQMLMNLLINASEAIGERPGTVTITTAAEEMGHLNGQARYFVGRLPEPGSYVTLQVQDDGCGMDEGTLARIFDPFFSTKEDGRGLGLPVVMGIVRGHEGALRVNTAPGAGATFKLFFPVARPAAATLPEVTASAGRGVLVVDDETGVREAAVDILSMDGLRVFAAADGESGVEQYQQHRDEIDLVLLDLSMPGMNGLETRRALRQVNPGVRILLSSGYSELDVSEHLVQDPATEFLQKPYNMAALLHAVREQLAPIP
jgi:nitrogen-specific signal transduction histidine kinase/CheY-like chemotaxis protein